VKHLFIRCALPLSTEDRTREVLTLPQALAWGSSDCA
jgi:hypothetical protein